MSDRLRDEREFELTAFYADEPPGMTIRPDPSGRGFLLLNERRFVAEWSGGADPGATEIRYDGPRPSGRALSGAIAFASHSHDHAAR